jgi:hypothetical protein
MLNKPGWTRKSGRLLIFAFNPAAATQIEAQSPARECEVIVKVMLREHA